MAYSITHPNPTAISDELLNKLSHETVASITGYRFIEEALSVANIL